jgi:PAS domain S-box-containing protein
LKNIKRLVFAALALVLVMTAFTGCAKKQKNADDMTVESVSFRNIPGITQSEINAIDALLKKHESFVYGITPSTEAFINKNGEIQGYAPMFCDLLTQFFGIPFKTVSYEWGDLLRELEAGNIDFTGELMANPEHWINYYMTSPITERSLKVFRIRGSEPLETIMKSRTPRYAFLEYSVLLSDVTENSSHDFEIVFVENYNAAYDLLKSGKADAFFGMNTAEGAFDVFEDVVTENFTPLIFKSTCLSTGNAELAPLINAVEKALDKRTLGYLSRLYKEGYHQYLTNKLYNILTEEEKAYIQNNPVIPFAAEADNYPLYFFDTNTNEWHGMFDDIMAEITKLTGLSFKRVNDQNAKNQDLIAMLEKGEVLMMPELFRLKEYEGRFLWSEIPVITDSFAIVSKLYYENLEINQIPYLKIGVRRNSVYSEFFKKMFPNHQYLFEYDTQEEVWKALKLDDEIELIFACTRRLLTYTNFYEEAGYKLNLILDYTFDSSFGYNKDAAIIKSIVDKSLGIININNISNQWMHKTYDYRAKLRDAQRPWLIGALVMFFIVLSLVTVLLIKSKGVGRNLEKLVSRRTNDLAFQTSKLMAMIDSIPDLMFCKDTNLQYTQCNRSFEQFLGINEIDIINKADNEGTWLPPEQVERIRNIELDVINENKVITLEEKVRSPITGKENIFETVKAPLKQDGAVVGIIAIIRNITERKEMEQELAYQTSLFKTMLSSLPDAVFCKNLEYKYTLINNYMADVFGKRVEDIIGKDDANALGLSPATMSIARESDKKAIEEKKRVVYEEWIHCSDGYLRLYETVKTPLILNGAVIGVMAIARDITQRKEMEEEAMAASRAKSSFLANMSHELRTPLNVIIGLTDLILEEEMIDHIRGNLIKISNAGNTLLSIVNDILDFSKIESGKLSLNPVEYYVSSMLNDIITLVMARIGEKAITFSLNINDDLPNKLYGDDLRVKQIFTNLLTNAAKYTSEGSIELTVRCTREGGSVWMEAAVKDTGMGIPREDIKNLFLDYYQVTANSTRNIEGTGLGLPITKRLVQMMDGELDVESEHKKGSTFRFRIKQGFVNDIPIGTEVSNKLRTFCYSDDKRVVSRKLVRVNLSYARVLVVDDMQTNLDVAAGILRKYQMQVDCLTNGPAAIERIREGTTVYDAIFMDHMMPGMDGIETVEKIRALGTSYAKKIPIIALTANAIQGTDKMFYAHDFQAYISKPIDIMEMDFVLRKWVRKDTHDDAAAGNIPAAIPVENEDVKIAIKIPGVDTNKGLSLYAGETDIYIPLLRSYITNTPGTLSKLKAVTKETLSDYVITVHGLKGTSAGIGAETVREAALELETKSRAGDLQGVLAKNDALIADTEVVVANIKKWLDNYDSKNAKPRLKAPDRELLKKLQKCCESYDMSGIDEIMSELDKNSYDEDGELVAWLKEKIDISEIGEAAARLAGING